MKTSAMVVRSGGCKEGVAVDEKSDNDQGSLGEASGKEGEHTKRMSDIKAEWVKSITQTY